MSPEERRDLLAVARAAIEERLGAAGALASALESVARTPALEEARGAFVTLEDEDLRGCIGRIVSSDALVDTVVHCARAAAFEDPRFPPMTADAWPGVRISISVLTPPVDVAGADAVEIGSHGVVFERGHHRSVFLPQVAVEQGWDRTALLENLARKAGLPREGWRGGRLSVFETESFGEPGLV